MSEPLVSVVVPTYDRAGHVETALLSLLRQDYPALEVIAIDDGSADETPAVLARIAEREAPERFRWLRHDNAGQSATINRGLAEARGELLGYLSSDDVLLPGAISTLVAAAQETPDADVVYPWFALFDAADRPTDRVEPFEHTLVDALRWALCLPGVGALVRRRAYERTGGWNPQLRTCPDYDWWLRMGTARFVCVPQVLGAWRTHDGSISQASSRIEQLHERLGVLDALFARDDLAPEVAAVRDEAYGALLTSFGVTLTGASPDARFVCDDVVGRRLSPRARHADAAGRIHLLHANRSATQQLARAQEAIGEWAQTAAVLQDAAGWRDGRIAVLEAELADTVLRLGAAEQARDAAQARAAALAAAPPPAPAGRPAEGASPDEAAAAVLPRERPPWLAAARAATPPALRPRAGAALHRLTRRGR